MLRAVEAISSSKSLYSLGINYFTHDVGANSWFHCIFRYKVNLLSKMLFEIFLNAKEVEIGITKISHCDQQVYITVQAGLAARVGAKQPDLRYPQLPKGLSVLVEHLQYDCRG